jgi:hypothetical protein
MGSATKAFLLAWHDSGVGGTPFDAVKELPYGLDSAQAVVYEEAVSNVTGRWLVWPDRPMVYRQRPDHLYVKSVDKSGDFDGPQWTRVS